jgi:putative hydroxymethylpyrimidine transport system substrate-binding protein
MNKRRETPLRHSSIAARLLAVCGALACLATLAACGSKQDTLSASSSKRFDVMLDWFPNADHAALYEAIDHGDFRAAGLDVHPVQPSETAEPLKLLAEGKVDMAISYEPQLLLAREEGLKVVSVGALVQRPLTSIIALPGRHVSSVADLKGKSVGTAGIAYQAAYLHTALQSAGLDPSAAKEVNVGFNLVPAMLSHKVDATLGGFWNYEAIQLRQKLHKQPLVIPVDEAGVPTYDELVLAVREDEAHTRGQELRSFLQALSRGERRAQANPSEAAEEIVKANPDAERKLQVSAIERTLPATVPSDSSKPYGWQDPTAWEHFGQWMFAHHLLRSDPNLGGLPPFTNEFLPGQGI